MRHHDGRLIFLIFFQLFSKLLIFIYYNLLHCLKRICISGFTSCRIARASGILLRGSQRVLQNHVLWKHHHIVISTRNFPDYSRQPSYPCFVVLESIQDDGAFAKLKQIILCKLHRTSLCFYVNRVAYNNHLNCNNLVTKFVNAFIYQL